MNIVTAPEYSPPRSFQCNVMLVWVNIANVCLVFYIDKAAEECMLM